MPKKPRSRTFLESQHVKGSEALHKSTGKYFCHIFWSLLNEISAKISVLMVSVILQLFVNILEPDNQYYLSVKTSV